MSEKMSAEELERLDAILTEDINPMTLLGSNIEALWHCFSRDTAAGLEHTTRVMFARAISAKQLRTHISALQREADGMREALAVHEKRTAFMRKISPHVAAMLDEYDAPVAAVLSEGCGSPQDRSSEEKQ